VCGGLQHPLAAAHDRQEGSGFLVAALFAPVCGSGYFTELASLAARARLYRVQQGSAAPVGRLKRINQDRLSVLKRWFLLPSLSSVLSMGNGAKGEARSGFPQARYQSERLVWLLRWCWCPAVFAGSFPGLVAREPRANAPHWTGRRWFAVIDAVAWPLFWTSLLS
jgi:hypothetical protein